MLDQINERYNNEIRGAHHPKLSNAKLDAIQRLLNGEEINLTGASLTDLETQSIIEEVSGKKLQKRTVDHSRRYNIHTHTYGRLA